LYKSEKEKPIKTGKKVAELPEEIKVKKTMRFLQK